MRGSIGEQGGVKGGDADPLSSGGHTGRVHPQRRTSAGAGAAKLSGLFAGQSVASARFLRARVERPGGGSAVAGGAVPVRGGRADGKFIAELGVALSVCAGGNGEVVHEWAGGR